jgi:hypothetical protein
MPIDQEHSVDVAKTEVEQMLTGVAFRYGLRRSDFSVAWDDGKFEPGRPIHDLFVIRRDGRRAKARVHNDALMRRDPWKYFRELEGAVAQLRKPVELGGTKSDNKGPR